MKFERADFTSLVDLILSKWKEWKTYCLRQELCSEFDRTSTKVTYANEFEFAGPPFFFPLYLLHNPPRRPDTQQLPEFSSIAQPLVRSLQRHAAPEAPAIITLQLYSTPAFPRYSCKFQPEYYSRLLLVPESSSPPPV